MKFSKRGGIKSNNANEFGDQGGMLDGEDIQDIRVNEGRGEEQDDLLFIQDNDTIGTNVK